MGKSGEHDGHTGEESARSGYRGYYRPEKSRDDIFKARQQIVFDALATNHPVWEALPERTREMILSQFAGDERVSNKETGIVFDMSEQEVANTTNGAIAKIRRANRRQERQGK